jgi:hypothetical protein
MGCNASCPSGDSSHGRGRGIPAAAGRRDQNVAVAVDGHPSAFREVRPAGLRPAQEPAPTDTSGNGSQPPTTEVGVHLIHHIPAGTACVEDQVVRVVKQDQSFKELLYTQYKDAAVAETLTQANDLLADGQGQGVVYVPPGDRVVIPAMCYTKSGAGGVARCVRQPNPRARSVGSWSSPSSSWCCTSSSSPPATSSGAGEW